MRFFPHGQKRPPGDQPARFFANAVARPIRLAALCAGLFVLLGIRGLGFVASDQGQPRGLPFIRTYPLDEIGKVPRGLRLSFDSFGRFAVMYDGIFSVLNDAAWVNRIDTSSPTRGLMTTIRFINGRYFYCGRNSWGTVDLTPDGLFRAHPLVPSDAPAWTNITSFNDILGTKTGIYLYDLRGVIYWDFARQQNFFFELPRVSTVFGLGDRVFASCEDQILREFFPDSGSVGKANVTGLEGAVVERTAVLDPSHTLLALRDGRLMSFDGRTAVPWSPQARYRLYGRITALGTLVDGGVAIAIQGEGLFLTSSDGSLRWILNQYEFQRIGGLAANEAGVLWVAGENAVRKIFYNSPLTNFGRELGLTVAWPIIRYWNDRIVICSSNGLYVMEPARSGAPFQFKRLEPAPEGSIFGLAAHGEKLLVSTPSEVYAAGGDGRFVPVIKIEHVAALEFIEPDICIAIGNREIAALRLVDGRWTECASRIAGAGDVQLRSMVHGAIWLELGGDRVARITYRNGKLASQQIPLPWSDTPWTNIGNIGSTVVITGPNKKRTYYDETQEKLCAAPALDRLLDRSPYWIDRITEDSSGTLWATYINGVVRFTPKDGDYVVDATTFELRNDTYPWITVLPDDNIWIISSRSVFHVERSIEGPSVRPSARLVSLMADDPNLELLQQMGPRPRPQFAFDENSLSIRLFSGTYAWRYPPLYEYRLDRQESWKAVDPGLLLRFPKLRDGSYQLEVRAAGPGQQDSPPFVLDFVIKPPFYRTPLAYAGYAFALAVLVVVIVRRTNRRSIQRNQVLESLVNERTRQLKVTMEKLNEETRNAATLAERSRLAGEIHDSLQQGLSGSIMQLDTTMSTATIPPSLRSRLNIVRSMLSYTREEIQHSVLNLASPLLQNSNLGDALGKLAGFINSGSIRLNVRVPSQPVSLEPAAQHHFLRIAQEAITNAVKHAEAKSIEVVLESNNHGVSLAITDDGKGFDPSLPANSESHFGLRGMKTRARAMKAQLQVRSAPGAGTTVQIHIPSSHDSNDQNPTP